MARGDSAPMGRALRGRRTECAVLDGLLENAGAGQSGVLVLRGDAGIGKTALLEYAIEAATDLRVLRVAGTESEMELAFATLHQLCASLLDRLDGLPAPQRDALATTFGLRAGVVPDRFFVGLAVLGLLSEAAVERPLLCVIDDAQWLDRASAQALTFVARRLLAEPVVMLFAAREPSEEFAGLPELMIEGLGDADARALLASVIPGRLDERIAAALLAETGANPLALLELPRGLSTAQLAGGFGLPAALSVSGRIEESFGQRLEALPDETQRMLLVAAAQPTGDPGLLWRAAERLGITRAALEPAESAGLIEVDDRVRFRHPLVRSAVYRAAAPVQRRHVHQALAESTDGQVDPDRRAWHLAEASAGPNEDVADELERAAGRAQARGGLAAAAAFLDRAAALTPDPARQAQRALAAAQAEFEAGAVDDALALLATAETAAVGDLRRAQAQLLRGQIAFALRRGSDAPPLLLKAAHDLEAIDATLARATYLEALSAAMFAGRLARGELIEATARVGERRIAERALERLTLSTRPSGSDWALGVEARSRALLSDGDAADRLYQEAIERLRRTRVRVQLARTHLLYGEWLRRERRRFDARDHLRAALELFMSIGAEAFAARAERELLATGQRVRKRSVETGDELTAQEAQVARLARDGLSNAEIGERLFISHHTAAYHLRKVFDKLDITSRSQLRRVLPSTVVTATR